MEDHYTKRTQIHLLVSLRAFCGCLQAAHAQESNLILADGLGWETLVANGGANYPTPALDKLATPGVCLTHGYAQPIFFDLSKDPEEQPLLTVASFAGDAPAAAKRPQDALEQFEAARPTELNCPGEKADKAKRKKTRNAQ